MFERASWLTLVVGAALSVGCVDPEGAYKDFQERESKTTPATGAGCTPTTGTCTAPPVGEMDGQWLFALSATLKPNAPILFFTEVTTKDNAGVTSMQWSCTPLDAYTRAPVPPPEGDPIVLPATDLPADGNWTFAETTVAVTGKANPITHSDISANVVMTGDVCSGRDFLCGTVTGNVTKPIPLDLKGSSWTLERLTASDTLPEKIKIDCSCNAADPPEPPP
jgi:hypothetical protein